MKLSEYLQIHVIREEPSTDLPGFFCNNHCDFTDMLATNCKLRDRGCCPGGGSYYLIPATVAEAVDKRIEALEAVFEAARNVIGTGYAPESLNGIIVAEDVYNKMYDALAKAEGVQDAP
jgi:hypothetical protein